MDTFRIICSKNTRLSCTIIWNDRWNVICSTSSKWFYQILTTIWNSKIRFIVSLGGSFLKDIRGILVLSSLLTPAPITINSSSHLPLYIIQTCQSIMFIVFNSKIGYYYFKMEKETNMLCSSHFLITMTSSNNTITSLDSG